jgi:hypothetical protein
MWLQCAYLGTKGVKKWQTTSIAPLQPFILAVFLPWGGSTGAGRVRPAAANVRDGKYLQNNNSLFY